MTASLTRKSPPTADSARQAIEAGHRTYVAAMRAGDVAALVSHFTDDAILLPPNANVQRGQNTIRNWFASWLPFTTIYEFEINVEDLVSTGDIAYEVGSFRMKRSERVSDQINSESGNYLMVWKRDRDGKWRVFRDMINVNKPPLQAPS